MSEIQIAFKRIVKRFITIRTSSQFIHLNSQNFQSSLLGCFQARNNSNPRDTYRKRSYNQGVQQLPYRCIYCNGTLSLQLPFNQQFIVCHPIPLHLEQPSAAILHAGGVRFLIESTIIFAASNSSVMPKSDLGTTNSLTF